MTTYLDACRTKRTRRAAARALIEAGEHWNWTVKAHRWVTDGSLWVELSRGPWVVQFTMRTLSQAPETPYFHARWEVDRRAHEELPIHFIGENTIVYSTQLVADTRCVTLEEFEAALSQGFKGLDEHDAALEAADNTGN